MGRRARTPEAPPTAGRRSPSRPRRCPDLVNGLPPSARTQQSEYRWLGKSTDGPISTALCSRCIPQVYYVSGGQLKVANKQYNSTNFDYELTLTERTVVEEAADAENMHIEIKAGQLISPSPLPIR